MDTKLYIVRDEMRGSFTAPVLFPNEEFAKRWFHDYLKADRLRNDNPGDFSLWYVGEYDAKEGIITPTNRPELIERGMKHEIQN